MFFKFSVVVVCINVMHQKTQRERSSQSELFWLQIFDLIITFSVMAKTVVDRRRMRHTEC